jgi:hypothetical protein
MSDQDSKDNQGQGDQPNTGQTKPLFTVGDREYDVDAAVTKIKSADTFIDTLKNESKQKDQEIANLQAQLDQAKKLEDALEALKQKSSQGESNMSDNTGATTTVDIEALKQELLKQAREAATNSVTSFKQQEIAAANQSESVGAAKSRYGSEYETKLREMGAQLGLDDTAIDAMAKSNPALFKQTFGLNSKNNTGLYPDGSQNLGSSLKDPDLKQVNKHWSTSSKIDAQLANEAAINKLIKEANGDLYAVAQKLGVHVKNFAN